MPTIIHTDDALKVVKVDVEAMGQVAQRNGIQDVPTIALLRNGAAVATSVGVKFWRRIEADLGLAESRGGHRCAPLTPSWHRRRTVQTAPRARRNTQVIGATVPVQLVVGPSTPVRSTTQQPFVPSVRLRAISQCYSGLTATPRVNQLQGFGPTP